MTSVKKFMKSFPLNIIRNIFSAQALLQSRVLLIHTVCRSLHDEFYSTQYSNAIATVYSLSLLQHTITYIALANIY